MKKRIETTLGAVRPGQEFFQPNGARCVLNSSRVPEDTDEDVHFIVMENPHEPTPYIDSAHPQFFKVEVEQDVLTWPDLNFGELFRFVGDTDLAESAGDCGYYRFGSSECFDGRRDQEVVRVEVTP